MKRSSISGKKKGFIMTDSWFKVDVFFLCPFCKQKSTETLLIAADRHDPAAAANGARNAVHPLTCQNCKKQAPQGIPTQVGINNLTPEELAKLDPSGPTTKPM